MGWRRITRFSLVYFVLSLVGLFMLDVFMFNNGPREVPYSEFLRAIDAKTIAEARIGERSVLWTEQGRSEPLMSTRLPLVDDATLIDQLHASGAAFGGVWESGGWGTWLSWIVPIVLIVGLWGIMLSRFASHTQALSVVTAPKSMIKVTSM